MKRLIATFAIAASAATAGAAIITSGSAHATTGRYNSGCKGIITAINTPSGGNGTHADAHNGSACF